MSENKQGVNNEVMTVEKLIQNPLVYNSKPCVTLMQVDQVHKRPGGTAGRNFRQNRNRFVKGMDFYEVNSHDEIRRVIFKGAEGALPNKVILVTESGYLMLVKSFTDDLSWQVQRKLVNSYFQKAVNSVAPEIMNLLSEIVSAVRILSDNQNAERPAPSQSTRSTPITNVLPQQSLGKWYSYAEAKDMLGGTDDDITIAGIAAGIGLLGGGIAPQAKTKGLVKIVHGNVLFSPKALKLMISAHNG